MAANCTLEAATADIAADDSNVCFLLWAGKSPGPGAERAIGATSAGVGVGVAASAASGSGPDRTGAGCVAAGCGFAFVATLAGSLV